jgi:hypothetical protein
VTRVGFRPFGGAVWQGGRTYLWNLLHAITTYTRELQPVLLVPPGEDVSDLLLPGVERFDTNPLLDAPRVRTIGRVLELAIRRNPVERAWLARARVDVLSHAAPVGGVPTIGWIPDVQHRHLTKLTSRYEAFMRDLTFREMLRDATIVVASSEHARGDLVRWYGADERKLRVLQFVSQPRLAPEKMIALADLRAKFELPARFVHLPNQLWKHKNHALVVDALRAAPGVVVVATGPREDYRHAGVYDALLAHVRAAGVADRFVHLGLVSFPELISLMHHAVAVVNPSRFEGWSTTVEEAKSLGKRVLVSDIPVHREQAPARASYFSVDDPDALATLLVEVWHAHDPAEDERAMRAAAEALPARTREFAERYAAIVRAVR